MKLEFSQREKNLIFILVILVVLAVAYTFYFSNALDRWVEKRTIYQYNKEMVQAMEQSAAELEERQQYVARLKEEAQELARGYYLDYTPHMTEIMISKLLEDKRLASPYVQIGPLIKEPFLMYGFSQEAGMSVQASRISAHFWADGTMNQMIDLLDTLQKDSGIHILNFSMMGANEQDIGMTISVEVILGDTEGTFNE